MINLIDFLSKYLPLSKQAISSLLLIIVLYGSAALISGRVRRRAEIRRLRTDARYQVEHFGKIQEGLAQISGQLQRLFDASELEDRKRQADRIRVEITRVFPGESGAAVDAYVFALLHNMSADPIYDCRLELLLRGQVKGSEDVPWIYQWQQQKFRFVLNEPFVDVSDINFSITFTDYFNRRWKLSPGQLPQEIAWGPDLVPASVVPEPKNLVEPEGISERENLPEPDGTAEPENVPALEGVPQPENVPAPANVPESEHVAESEHVPEEQ